MSIKRQTGNRMGHGLRLHGLLPLTVKISKMKKASIFLLAAVLVIVACEKNDSNANADLSSTGKGGSLAKFTIIGSYLYAVSSHYLYAVDISNPSKPVKSGQS